MTLLERQCKPQTKAGAGLKVARQVGKVWVMGKGDAISDRGFTEPFSDELLDAKLRSF